jgi:Ca2+-binding EF-hand superfamily protein
MDETFSLTGVKDATPLPVTSQEDKELRRVYDLLCDYHRKKILKKELNELLEWQESLTTKMQQQTASGVIVDMERYDTNINSNQERVDTLRREIADIDSNPEKLICCNDVVEMVKTLKQKVSKKDVEEMIWECDEDLDGCLNWDEFRLMFSRNILDKSGLEPSRMVRSATPILHQP